MYAWWRARLPARLVDTGYALWYALLLTLVLYSLDRMVVDIYYLHG